MALRLAARSRLAYGTLRVPRGVGTVMTRLETTSDCSARPCEIAAHSSNVWRGSFIANLITLSCLFRAKARAILQASCC